jgi:uncharacterized protein
MRNFKEIEDFMIGRLKRELPKNLYYHGVHHTLDVLESAQIIGKKEKISEEEMFLLKVAVLYHDAGFLKVYKDHEEVACDLVKAELPGFGFNNKEIEIICGMIMATKIPQRPNTHLEEIIADADLEYLGTNKFEEIGRTLFEEIKLFLDVESERQWNIIQLNFLRSHHYFTPFCKEHRESEKQKHLKIIEKIVADYE